MKSISFSSLRVRLILLVLLAVIPALGLIFYTAQEQRSSASVEAQQNALRLARMVSANQHDVIEGARQLLTALAQIPVVRGGQPAPCSAFLENLLRAYPLYANFGVNDTSGEIICSGLPLPGPVNVADRAWFRGALESRDLVISDYIVGRVTGKATLGLAYPVLDEAGEVQAVLYAGLDLGWLNALVAKTELPAGATLTVIDRKGTVLARFPNPEKWVGKSMSDRPLIRTILGRAKGTTEASDMDGISRLYGFSPLGDTGGGYVSIGIPKDVAFATANRILARNLIALVVVAVLALVAAWFGSDLVVLRQVKALTRATKRLSAGDLSARTGLPYGQGELTELARTFDQMAASMEQLITERKRSEQRLASLHEINVATTSSLDLRAVLKVLMEKIDLVLPYAAVLVWLTNKDSGRLERAACWNLDEKEWKGRNLPGTPALVKAAIEGKAPVVASNVQTDPRTLDPELYRRNGLVSYLGVPLIVQSEVLGVLVFLTREEHQFTEEEIEFLSTLAGQAAIAIRNSQLYGEVKAAEGKLGSINQRLESSLKELSSLYAALTPLAPAESVQELMNAVIERLMEATGADAALIRLQDKEGGFYWASQRGFPDYYLKAAASPPSGSALEWIFNTGEPILASNIAADPRFKGKVQLHVGMRSCAMLPLKIRNEVRGILHLASRQLGYFDEEQREHLMAIARQMGIALENRDLFDQLKLSTDQLEKTNKDLERREEIQKLLKELSQDITSLDIDSLVKKLTDKVLQFFKVDISDVRVGKVGRILGVSGIDEERIRRGSTASGRGGARWVFENRKPLIIPDISKGKDLPIGKTVRSIGIRGYLAVPLFSRSGEVLGILRVLTYQPREFLQEEIDLLQQMANGAAIALENARLLEETKNQAADLLRANEVKDEFLGFVSHELKTPVNAILGYIALLQDKMFGEINSEQETALEKIMLSCTALLNMMNSLLEATRIEAGAVQIEIHEVDLAKFLEEIRSVHDVPLNKELALIWDYPPGLPVVQTDGEKVGHILQNLINNAIKYTDKGSVTVSARHLADLGAVEFEVADTGIGIPEEALPFIFEKFCQVNGSRSRSLGGVGLGLHIVKKFTELLGGEISVKSELGRGSTFTVRIPCMNGSHTMAGKSLAMA